MAGRMPHDAAKINTPSQRGRHSLPCQACLGSRRTSPQAKAWSKYLLSALLSGHTIDGWHLSEPYLGGSDTASRCASTCHGIQDFQRVLHSFGYRTG